ncbi:unnamed protein product, partial [Rotaria sp. Silwood1]
MVSLCEAAHETQRIDGLVMKFFEHHSPRVCVE